MTLPTGTISMSQVNVELGRASTALISLGESAVRTLAGVPSGAISMNDLRGKSAAPVWTPNGGASAGAAVALSDQAQLFASVQIDCSVPAVWNYTEVGDGSASVASGGTDTSITFQVSTVPFGGFKTAYFTVNSTAGGITRYWTVSLTAEDGS